MARFSRERDTCMIIYQKAIKTPVPDSDFPSLSINKPLFRRDIEPKIKAPPRAKKITLRRALHHSIFPELQHSILLFRVQHCDSLKNKIAIIAMNYRARLKKDFAIRCSRILIFLLRKTAMMIQQSRTIAIKTRDERNGHHKKLIHICGSTEILPLP
ncbi:MAG: hypothetical protein ABIQ57_16415 [Candidatus Kapaibacterium sp.]